VKVMPVMQRSSRSDSGSSKLQIMSMGHGRQSWVPPPAQHGHRLPPAELTGSLPTRPVADALVLDASDTGRKRVRWDHDRRRANAAASC
jgi:hypothetical protein